MTARRKPTGRTWLAGKGDYIHRRVGPYEGMPDEHYTLATELGGVAYAALLAENPSFGWRKR